MDDFAMASSEEALPEYLRRSHGETAIAQYAWSFDDGCASLAQNPTKTSPVAGSYQVRLTVSDDAGNTARLTIPVTATASGGARFLRSDCKGDGRTDISDPAKLLLGLFGNGGAPPPCADACDANDSGALDVADPIATLAMLFAAGPLPGFPYPACGEDPNEDALGCASPPPGCR